MASDMKFIDLCKTLDKIFAADKDKKFKTLRKLLEFCRQQSNDSTDKTKPSVFYLVVRLLLPKHDLERGAYGVKEHNLGKMYCRMLCFSKDSAEANKLMRFRTPAASSTAGDFADVAYWLLKSRCRHGGNLSIEQVNSYLDDIAKFHAENKPRSVDEVLTTLAVSMSAEEQKWLIRALLKDMRLGLGASSILNAIHPDARDLFDTCNNLHKVCDTLVDPLKRLHEIEVSMFEPCRPMLSDKCDILDVEKVLPKAPYFFLERKHDGERFQLHVENGSFRYFSRNGHDYTDHFGPSSNTGVLTPQLSRQLHSDTTSCILDGEMMAWNKQWKCFVAKGQKFDVKNLREGNKHKPCFCVFDVLLLNGEVLTNKPLKERLEILNRVFTPVDGVFMHTPRKEIKTSAEVVKALNDAIDNQEEGLILKNPYSVYKPASHSGGWYKIKPEFTDQLSDDLDLLIVGGYYGEGQRRGNITHFLLGVAVPPAVEGNEPTEFLSFCRVGSGYSREELSELSEKLSPYWNNVKPGHMPPCLRWSKEKPDLWIKPHYSYILQVRSPEIVPSDQYRTECTLRFPRVMDVRYDKKWTDCLTVDQLNTRIVTNKGKLTSKHVHVDDIGSASPRKKMRTKVAPTVGQEYRPADTRGVTQIGTRLSGKEFVVMSGNDHVSKQQLEEHIASQGGTVVQNRGSDTFCVIIGKNEYRAKNVSAFGGVDVVTVDWLLRVLDGQNFDWTPHDLLSMSEKTKDIMVMKYDRFFDGFQEPTNEKNLKLSLQKVSEEGASVNLLPSEIADLDQEIFGGPNQFAVFRCCIAYFPKVDNAARERDLLCILFRFQGGCVSNTLSADVTHVVVHTKDFETFNKMKNENHTRPKKFHIVTYDWVDCCWSAHFRLKESDFHPQSLFYL